MHTDPHGVSTFVQKRIGVAPRTEDLREHYAVSVATCLFSVAFEAFVRAPSLRKPHATPGGEVHALAAAVASHAGQWVGVVLQRRIWSWRRLRSIPIVFSYSTMFEHVIVAGFAKATAAIDSKNMQLSVARSHACYVLSQQLARDWCKRKYSRLPMLIPMAGAIFGIADEMGDACAMDPSEVLVA